MGDFIRQNSILLILGALALFYVWVIISARARQQKTESFLTKAQSDSEEYKRHNAAVEAKLDRIIALMERPRGDE